MNTELLKKKILQLAMQGKLVEQDESDGTADELIDQILEEKKKLMSEGKIKKEKLSRIYKNPTDNHYYEKFDDGKEKDITDEIPYTIPFNWSWQRIGTYAEKVTDEVASGSFQAIRDNVKTYKEENYALMVKTADFSNNFTNNLTYTDKHGYEFLSNSNLYGGELILCNIGSIGKVFIVPNLNKKMTLAPNSIMIRLTTMELTDFLYYLLQSPYGFSSLMDKSSGTGMRKLNKKDFKSILIPIPPRKEQFRICKKILEILPKISNINKSYSKINLMYEGLKSKIIDLAIKGELTKQLSTDEPSSKLIENIIEEKHKLMAEGKIKKENLSIIYKDSDNQFYEKFDDGKIERITDSIPFELPENWCWTRLRSIVYNHGQKIPDKTFSYIDIGTLDNINHKLNNIDNILESGKAPSRARKIVKYNDILYATVRPYLHNICIIDRDFLYEPIASTGFAVLSCLTGIYNRYLFIMLLSTFFDDYVKNHSQGVSYPAINDTYLYNALIPLPPKEEQKRIVSQIQQLLIIIK